MRSKLALMGLLLAGVCALTTGCGSSSDGTAPTLPTPNPFSWQGKWTGTVTDATLGTAPADMDLDQEGSVITGEVGISFGGEVGRLTGAAAGTATDTHLNINVGVAMPTGGCAIVLEGDRAGNTVSGTLSKGTCTYPFAGTFTATKG